MKQKLLNSLRLRVCALVAFVLCAVGSAWAQTTVTTTSFSAVSGNVGNDTKVTYAAYKGGGTSNPAVNSNALRLYQNANGATAGYVVIGVAEGYSITSATIQSTMATTTGYKLSNTDPESTTPDKNSFNVSNYSLSANTDYTVSNISTRYITFACFGTTSNSRLYLSKISITYQSAGSGPSAEATTTTINASGITNTDVYTNTAAGSLAATVTAGGNAVAGATVTWSGNNDDVATIDANGAVTLVAAGTVTFTASYAGVANTYLSSSATYEMTVTSSAPYVQPTTVEITPNYTFWGKTAQFSGNTYSELSGSKDNVTLSWTRGSGSTYANQNAMRFYKDNTLTFTAPTGYEIKSIELTVSGTYSDLSFVPTGDESSTTTWTGASQTVTMSRPSTGSNYATISKFTITIGLPSTDPSISADDVNIAYDATGGTINYTINNPVEGGSVSVDFDSEGDWLTATVNNGTVSFTCTANATNAERLAYVEITYTYNTSETVTKGVYITQAAAPVIYTTIPALFAAATSTETDVRVTFGGWVVSAVHNNNAYLTDNQGNGLIIYANGHGFQVNDVLTGTVSCKLVLYRGSAELKNLTTSTEGLTVTQNGSVTAQTIAISDLGGVNTGALLSFEGLTYNGTALVDGNSNVITPYNALYNEMSFGDGKSYDVTGIYAQYNDTKEILPRSAADIVEVQVQHQEYDLTVSLGDNVGAIFVFDVEDDTDPLIADGAAGTVQVADGTQVLVSPDVASGYVLESLMVDGVNVTSQMDNSGAYTFTMPKHAVTISATAEVYVAPVGTNYTLASTITSGKHYIIVNNEASKAMGTQNSNNRSAGEILINNRTATVASNAGVAEFVIYGPDAKGCYTIYDAAYNENAGGYLYAANSSNNYLRTQADLDDNGRWVISIDNDGVASIVAQGSNSHNVMQYNSSSTLFACYGSASQKPVYLFEKDGEETPTESKILNGSGYATYCSQNALDFTNNSAVTAWAITAANSTSGVITFNQIEGKAPAGTGMLLKGGAGANITMTAATAGEVEPITNLLKGTTAPMTVDDNEYYGLSGSTFVKVNAGTVPAGKALLPANEVLSEVKSFTFVFEGADGIKTVEHVSAEEAAEIFNLAGQRMSKPQRGVNIINGKKVLVK